MWNFLSFFQILVRFELGIFTLKWRVPKPPKRMEKYNNAYRVNILIKKLAL